MSTLELPTTAPERLPAPPQTASRPTRLLARPSLTIEHLAYLVIGLLAILAHVWNLGDRALHHDETLHATYSWYIYTGRDYIHDPLLHGPFLYFFGALMYFLFGDNDFTARLGVAIFGVLLTLSPYLLRRELGRVGALLAAVYLLVSPSMLYMGRFVRHDMYSLLFEMLVVVGLLRYLASRRAGWFYLAMGAYGLMITNQETSYLFAVIWGSLIAGVLFWRIWKPGLLVLGVAGVLVAALIFVLPAKAVVDGENNAERDPATGQILARAESPLGWRPLETSDNNYALRIRNRSDNDGGRTLLANLGLYLGDLWRFFGHPAVLLAISTLLAAAALLYWGAWQRRDATGRTAWQRAYAQGDDGLLAAFASLSNRRMLLIGLTIFATIYTVLFTAFFNNLLGVITGTTGSVLYWLAQHDVKRGGQPWYYYLVLLTVYEPLLLVWSAGAVALMIGIWRRLRPTVTPVVSADGEEPDEMPVASAEPQLSPLTTPIMLLWWALAALAIYSWAGEKMPWLTIHMTLPLTLLASWGCARAIGWALRPFSDPSLEADAQQRALDYPLPLALVVGLFLVICTLSFLLMSVSANNPTGGGPLPGPLLLLGLLVILVGLLYAATGLRYGWRWSAGALALALTLALGVFTLRSSWRLSYLSGDVPREAMIYTQTSPDVMRVVRRLEQASKERYNNLSMPVIYDNETVWLWYMRNFTAATNSGQTLTPPGEEVQAVVMLQENIDSYPQNLENLQGFMVQRLPLRWWLPEDDVYRLSSTWREVPLEQTSLLGRVLRAPFDSQTLADTWQYMVYRNPNAPLGSSDFVIAVRPELADEIGLGTGGER